MVYTVHLFGRGTCVIHKGQIRCVIFNLSYDFIHVVFMVLCSYPKKMLEHLYELGKGPLCSKVFVIGTSTLAFSNSPKRHDVSMLPVNCHVDFLDHGV